MERPNHYIPSARRQQGLLLQQLPDELLVYDVETHKAHCLNEIAAFVWARCDGQTSRREIATALHEALGVPDDERVVTLALSRLSKARLMQQTQSDAERLDEPNRRDVLRKLGMAALPAIVTILAPTPAHAASCAALNLSCALLPCCSPYRCTGAPLYLCHP